MEMSISWHKMEQEEVKHTSHQVDPDAEFDFEKIKKYSHGLDLSWYDSGQKKSESGSTTTMGRHVSWYDGIKSSEMYYNLDGTKKRCVVTQRKESS